MIVLFLSCWFRSGWNSFPLPLCRQWMTELWTPTSCLCRNGQNLCFLLNFESKFQCEVDYRPPVFLFCLIYSLGHSLLITLVKVFTVDPYFGGMFKVECQRRAQNRTCGQFCGKLFTRSFSCMVQLYITRIFRIFSSDGLLAAAPFSNIFIFKLRQKQPILPILQKTA